jgi:hypothetical protein
VGKHAAILKKYSRDKQAEDKIEFVLNNNDGKRVPVYIFENMYQCFAISAVLGLIHNKKAEESSGPEYATIFADMLNKPQNNGMLMRIFENMVFSDPDLCLSMDERVKKAFTPMSDDEKKENLEYFKRYVRGGLEIIDDMFKNCSTYEDITNVFINIKTNYPL